MSPKLIVTGGPGFTPRADLDSAVTYKGVQVSLMQNPPDQLTAAQLDTLNAGSARGISHIAGLSAVDMQSHFDDVEAYWATLRAPPAVFPIHCIEMEGGLDQATWLSRVRMWVSTCYAGIYELGNEPGPDFQYKGAGADWSGFYTACEEAANVIHNEFKAKCIIGAARDTDTNPFLAGARTKWGTSWPFDGVAIHPYGQQGSGLFASDRHNLGIQQVRTRLIDARAPNRVPQNIPLWCTEIGWAPAGNTNSTLVAGEYPVKCNIDGDQPATNATINVNENPAVRPGTGDLYFPMENFPTSGRLFLLNKNGRYVLLSYTGRSQLGAQWRFTGCEVINLDGTPATPAGTWPGTLGNGREMSLWVASSPGRRAEQASLLTDMYVDLWGRRNKTGSNQLNIKSIGWFIGHDYVGHTTPPNGPHNWAEYCGLQDYAEANRDAWTAFLNQDKTRPYS